MRIALVGPATPYRGGIAHFSNELAKTLTSRNHEVWLETFRRQYPALLFPGTTQLEGNLSDLPADTRADIDSINPWSWVSTGRRLHDQHFDLILFSYWLSFFVPAYAAIARLARSSSGTRIGAVVHNALPHERRIGDRLFSRYFLRRCDGLITLSSAVRDSVRMLGVDTPAVEAGHPAYSHFGAAIEPREARAALGLPQDAPILLFFGFVRRYKGLDLLIEALPEVLEIHQDTQLVVAGEFYEDEEYIRRRTSELGVTEAVHFDTRYIPDERVHLYFSAADLVVQPYRSATQSGVAHVAFHFARPIVVTDVGGLAETVPHLEAGMVVPAGDPEALGGAIIRFLEDDELRARLRSGAADQGRLYTWDQLAQDVERLATPVGFTS